MTMEVEVQRTQLFHREGKREIQGGPSARRLGYVDINSVSFGGYPEMQLSQHNPVREQIGHPVERDSIQISACQSGLSRTPHSHPSTSLATHCTVTFWNAWTINPTRRECDK